MISKSGPRDKRSKMPRREQACLTRRSFSAGTAGTLAAPFQLLNPGAGQQERGASLFALEGRHGDHAPRRDHACGFQEGVLKALMAGDALARDVEGCAVSRTQA